MIRRRIPWVVGGIFVIAIAVLAMIGFGTDTDKQAEAIKDDEPSASIVINEKPLPEPTGAAEDKQAQVSGGSSELGSGDEPDTGSTPTPSSTEPVSKSDGAGEPSNIASNEQPSQDAQSERREGVSTARGTTPETPTEPSAVSEPLDAAASIQTQPSGADLERSTSTPDVRAPDTLDGSIQPDTQPRERAMDSVPSTQMPAAPSANVQSAGRSSAAVPNQVSDEAVERASGVATVAGAATELSTLPDVSGQTPESQPTANAELANLNASDGSAGSDRAGELGRIVMPMSKPTRRTDPQAPDVETGVPAVSTPTLPVVSDPTPPDESAERSAPRPTAANPSGNETGDSEDVQHGGSPEPTQPDGSPLFDIVRVDRDGQTVIAGTAQPNEKVEILLDGVVVGEAFADATGQFVAVVFANLSGTAQRLELRSLLPPVAVGESEPDAISDIAPEVSLDIQDLSNPAIGGESAPVASASSSPDVTRNSSAWDAAGTVASPGQVGTVAAASPPIQRHAVSAPVIILPAQEAEGAPTLVQPRPEGLAMLQPAEREILGVVLDSISYDDSGAVILSGRGVVERVIRIYANGKEAGAARVDPDGRWVWASDVADPQNIKLFRLDELGPEGSVTSRIETPFKYERYAPKLVRDREVEIQRGDMLWRIAEQYYGEGIRYSMIYGANSELIRDPDLIYPGQIFTIPELVDAN